MLLTAQFLCPPLDRHSPRGALVCIRSQRSAEALAVAAQPACTRVSLAAPQIVARGYLRVAQGEGGALQGAAALHGPGLALRVEGTRVLGKIIIQNEAGT